MDHHLGARTLPVELLSLVFDTLSLQELLAASHVSNYWRTVAVRHPTIWRDITLNALSTTALDFFHARLDAGANRSIALHVRIPEVAFAARLRSVVLPAVTRNLARTHMLCLKLPLEFDVDVFAALHHPAPRLETFDIVMVHETRTSDALPVDLFASQAPNLNYTRLLNVQLFADAIPRVFSSLRTFRYCFQQPQSFPTAVFAHCRFLRRLAIVGKYFSLAVGSEQEAFVDPPELETVDIAVFTGCIDIMRCLPCASIPEISFNIDDQPSAELLLAHLQGRLELHIYQAMERLYVQYKSRDTGMQRTFVCLPSQAAAAYLPPVYVESDRLARVDAMYFSSDCAELLPAFADLPACTRAVISLENGKLDHIPRRALSAPALQRVEIASEAPARLAAGDLVAFLDRTFAPVTRKVHVALAGVILAGDLSVLGERFDVSQAVRP